MLWLWLATRDSRLTRTDSGCWLFDPLPHASRGELGRTVHVRVGASLYRVPCARRERGGERVVTARLLLVVGEDCVGHGGQSVRWR